MLSLGNAFTDEDVADFIARVRRFLGLDAETEIAVTAEPKIDGLSISLTYDRARLVQAATRGDGIEGENVTGNVMTIRQIPHRLSGKDVPDLIEVRGEIYLAHADFEKLNAEQAASGGKIFANPQECRGGLAAPARSLDHRAPPAALLRARLGRDHQGAGQDAVGRLCGVRALGPAAQPAAQGVQGAR